MFKKYLELFRDLKLSKNELKKVIPKDFVIYNPTIVCSIHVINLLECYISDKVDESYILDWVNTVWFSGWYLYCDEAEECIARVMNELEEIDEVGHELTYEKVRKYIYALKHNINI
jgi:hypothetical protein